VFDTGFENSCNLSQGAENVLKRSSEL
jgi:hypothetical protein